MKEGISIKILVSNDDGILAEGIQCLAEALNTIAEVTIVAPDRDRSGASNSLTLEGPLRAKKVRDRQYAVNGTPTDCVNLGINGMFEHEFDMVVSGINRGSNMGDDVLYSGTIAAAMEGRFLGLPAVAVSLASRKPDTYEDAAEYVKNLVLKLKKHPLPANTILSVNLPDIPADQLAGTQITRLGERHKGEDAVKQLDPRGREIFWIGEPGKTKNAELGTDFYAVSNNYVSITPLKIDLTEFNVMEQLSQCFDGSD